MFKINRTFIIVALTVLLVGAGYINWRYNNADTTPVNAGVNTTAKATTKPTASDASVATFFSNYKLDRETNRKDELDYLNQVINNAKTDTETLKAAQQQKLDITKVMEQETSIEGLLQAKGFKDVAVTFHDASINVIVGTKELAENQVAQILDIVKRASGQKAENIKIIPAVPAE